MKRLLVLCDTVGREGGTESYLARVLPELARTGAEIVLVARRVTDPAAFGIPAQCVPWSAENEPPSLSAASQISGIIARLQPYTVFTSNVFDAAVLAAARKAEKFVVRLHDHRAFCPNGDRHFPQFHGNCTASMGGACMLNAVLHGCVAGPRAATFDRLQARIRVRDAMLAADEFVVSSNFMAESCVRNGIAKERIVVAPPPIQSVPSSILPPAHPRARVLFAGRILPQKGLVSLVRALGYIAERHRPVLAVAGEPTVELDRARIVAGERGVHIDVLGSLSQDALQRAIDDSRALVVPSLWAEPFGLVGIEAQARGRPSVAYAVGGIPEWIGGAGIAVRPGDERALARAIEHVISDQHWSRYANAALHRAREFQPSRHIRVLREVLCA